MAPLIEKRKRHGARRQIISARNSFFPGEVVRILGLRGIDYRQLRELWNTIAPANRVPKKKWGRYTFADLVMLRAAVDLAGGREALKLGRRLRVAHLARVLTILQNRLGVLDPLNEIKLERIGTSILAHVSGAKLDPIESQYV